MVSEKPDLLKLILKKVIVEFNKMNQNHDLFVDLDMYWFEWYVTEEVSRTVCYLIKRKHDRHNSHKRKSFQCT